MNSTIDDLEIQQSAATEGTDIADGATIAVVGLGYVGLPLAVAFDRAGHSVIGFDISEQKVDTLNGGTDTTGDLGDDAIEGSEVTFTTDPKAINEAQYVTIAVPTPIDDLKNPNLDFVESAARTVGTHMSPGTTVVLESTVYPGATRDVVVPALEEESGLRNGEDFFVGYSPERATPGDEEHGLAQVVKIVSGQNDAVRDDLAELYGTVVDAGIHKAPSIETAEAAKAVENVQRDINIALVNELAMIFDKIDIDTHAVLEAAGTKWNFHDYRPGLVGGHCIPVDPFFLAYRAEQEGVSPDLTLTGREVNERMPAHVANQTIKALNESGKVLKDSRILILGLSYKPDVADIRTSKVKEIIEALDEYQIDISGFDPHAEPEAMRDAFGIDIQEELDFSDIDGVLLTTGHTAFTDIDLPDIVGQMSGTPVIVDVDNFFDPADADGLEFTFRRV
ncbi:nucleotide sugar dehydrogenase [Haladaptatus sp. GCM10025707]|uniref:nucleotide sugar dehydrogenase n=1 Tax=unclassified Haladaptatus TaxID=2622732 RepID=UPI0023E76A81|nr:MULTISPECIES: nucleotide sugar dehydrogenase [unclassified Haladaptatus]